MKTVKLAAVLLMLVTVIYPQENSSPGGTEWDNGIMHFKSNDGKFRTKFDVRMFIQGGKFSDDSENVMSNSTHLRKGRFAIKVKMWDYWQAEWDMDIADVAVEIKDMWVAYTGLNNAFVKLGNYKVPFGLEILTSSRYISFIERSYPSMSFKMGRRMALGYTKWGERWNVSGNYFGQTFYPGDRKDKNDEVGGGYAFRLAAAPHIGPLLIHGGVSYANYLPDVDEASNRIEFKSEPENKLGDSEHVDTGVIMNVDRVIQKGLEGAVRLNNFCVQGEYMKTDVNRYGDYKGTPYEDASFEGGYGFFSWLITGEKRPWDKTQGEFGQVIPTMQNYDVPILSYIPFIGEKLFSDLSGAWELLFRYSYINLSDPTATSYGPNPDGTNNGILGGKAINTTFGLTWYANPNVKFMANYIITDNSINADGEVSGGDYDFKSILFQALIYF